MQQNLMETRKKIWRYLVALKLAESQNVFYLFSNLPKKKVPDHAPMQYSPKEIVLRFGTFYWRFEPKLKTFRD